MIVVILMLVFIVGLNWIAQDFAKKTKEDLYELDSMRTEEEKQYARQGSFWGRFADARFKKKK